MFNINENNFSNFFKIQTYDFVDVFIHAWICMIPTTPSSSSASSFSSTSSTQCTHNHDPFVWSLSFWDGVTSFSISYFLAQFACNFLSEISAQYLLMFYLIHLLLAVRVKEFSVCFIGCVNIFFTDASHFVP